MKNGDKPRRDYLKRRRHIRLALAGEVLLTLCIAASVIATGCNGLDQQTRQTTAEINSDYDAVVSHYIAVFRTLIGPIKEEIATDPSFDEMLSWLQERESMYQAALGTDVYDGIAFTYKGGYARSWSYGDYSDYDPATRPWYQKAQQANGEIAVVAPYVTYLDADTLGGGSTVRMTIAQKYTDEISFDLDLKIGDIEELLTGREGGYEGEKLFLYDAQGCILSSSEPERFAHNIFEADEAISADEAQLIREREQLTGRLQLAMLDGAPVYLYFYRGSDGNTVAMLCPFMSVFVREFLLILLVGLLLIALEIYLYRWNCRNAMEFMWRDQRLNVVADASYSERLYVDLRRMEFYGNERAERMSGDKSYYRLFELLMSLVDEPSERPKMEAFLSPAVVSSGIQPFELKPERFMLRMQDKDGTVNVKTIEVSREAFTCDRRPMLCIAMRDASESADLLKASMKRTADVVREKAEEYNRFIGYICTAVDAVTELNLAERSMTRYSMQNGALVREYEKYPQDEWEMFHPDEREKMREAYSLESLRALCVENKTAYCECRMQWNHAKEYRWCTTILQGIPPTEEKPFNLLLIIKDTNEVRTREAQQKKALEDAFLLAKQGSQAKGSFLSKMSHEIRTPLNAIIGYLSIARDAESGPEKIRHCLDNSEIAARHLLQIINDVLDMSSIESGKMKIASADFDLKKELSDVTTIFYQNAKQKGVRFETQVEALSEEWVVGDQLRLNQVLMNLLSNAVKFTPEGGCVRLKVQQLDAGHDAGQVFVQFTVSDTGIGMSPEYMSRLFKPFEQESAATAQKYGGSGLGLSITRNLVQMMGGSISVDSRQNEGTSFTVTMHFDKSAHAPVTGPADFSHVRVLVVDDQNNDAAYAKSMLRRCGAKTDMVSSGEEALRRIRSRRGGDYAYDMCILDWSMPEMNGLETAKHIREEFGSDLPIIIATAYDITEFEDEAKAAGVNRVIAKPLFQSTLFDLLVSTFGGYNPAAGESAETAHVDMHGVRLILAEDNEMNMEIAVTVLERAGVKVDQARNGQEACELFAAAPEGTYDLILMDVQMPVMNGYEATQKIRTSGLPGAKEIPIVAMTANAFAEDVAEALSHGMNAHIAKPVSNDKLFAVLTRFRKH